jgi:hypothetical protein
MKGIIVGVFILLAVSLNGQGLANNKEHRLIQQKLKSLLGNLNSKSGIDLNYKTFEKGKVVTSMQDNHITHIVKGEIVYQSVCGTVLSIIEVVFVNEDGKKKLNQKSKLEFIEFLQPRCENDKYTPNSYNFIKTDNYGNKIQLP